jgi:predicted ribosomally synthesized peptide with nif11-like leader
MAREAVEAFLRKLPEDDKLREAYAAALKRATESALFEAAHTGGFEFSVEELRAVLNEREAELSDDQLRQVAGGVGTYACHPVETYAPDLALRGSAAFQIPGSKL